MATTTAKRNTDPIEPTRSQWMPYASMTRIDFSGVCIAGIRTNDGWLVIRPTTAGNYAVLALDGAVGRIVKILPTCDLARVYMAAMAH